jgi:hypothetical protein
MPLPDFNIDGVLPPFVGANGPGGHFEDLSPYKASVLDVVQGPLWSRLSFGKSLCAAKRLDHTRCLDPE